LLPLRTVFTAANITGTTTLDLQEDISYKVVHLPLALPIPFQVDDTTKCTINESSIDILDTTIDCGAFWAHCILAYDQAHSDKLIRRSTEGLGTVGNHLILPNLFTGQTWGSPSCFKVSVVGGDEEDEVKPAIVPWPHASWRSPTSPPTV